MDGQVNTLQDWFVLPLRFPSFMTKTKQNKTNTLMCQFCCYLFLLTFLGSVQNNWVKICRYGSVIKNIYYSFRKPGLTPFAHIKGLENVYTPDPGDPVLSSGLHQHLYVHGAYKLMWATQYT